MMHLKRSVYSYWVEIQKYLKTEKNKNYLVQFQASGWGFFLPYLPSVLNFLCEMTLVFL